MSFMTKVVSGLITPSAAGGTAMAAWGRATARGPPRGDNCLPPGGAE